MWYYLLVFAIVIVLGAFIRWQWNFLAGFWNDGGRGQFLVMGMPAVIFIVLGSAALGLAAFNLDKLDSKYENLVQKANDKARKVREEIIRKGKLDNVTNTNLQNVIDEDLRKELVDAQDQEKIFLEKLISLDGNNSEYKFKLAMLSFQQGEPQKALSLLRIISPFDEPGYAKGHLFLANYFLQERRKARSESDKLKLIEAAEQQIDNCLIADENSSDAKRIKAFIHDQKKQHLQAYEIYKELFEEDPLFYNDLLRLTSLLGRESERKSFLDQASYQFRQQTSRDSDNVAVWTDAWINYVRCMKMKGDMRSFNDAENAVKGEIQKFNDPTEIGKKVFLQRQLSRIYSDRAISLGRSATLEEQKQQLSDLAKAIENDTKNENALRWLTFLGTISEIGAEAKKIYDPELDPNVPWIVLSELGVNALINKEYEKAIVYFERARKKNPRHPELLNNLAYAYLEAKNQNAEQALLLVDQAVSILNKQARGRISPDLIASFYDTRGEALKQLKRFEDAIASFEIAYKNRPDDKDILQNLIDSCELAGDSRQAETFRRRLEKLKKVELETPK